MSWWWLDGSKSSSPFINKKQQSFYKKKNILMHVSTLPKTPNYISKFVIKMMMYHLTHPKPPQKHETEGVMNTTRRYFIRWHFFNSPHVEEAMVSAGDLVRILRESVAWSWSGSLYWRWHRCVMRDHVQRPCNCSSPLSWMLPRQAFASTLNGPPLTLYHQVSQCFVMSS